MGGCASRPKDLDINEPAPVQAPALEKVESEPTAQENNGGEETKTDEPLVDLSEPVGEAVESKPIEEATTTVAEEKVEEKAEEKVEAKAEEKVEAEVQPTTEVPEVEKNGEPVKEEAKPVEVPKSEEKSDAPILTA